MSTPARSHRRRGHDGDANDTAPTATTRRRHDRRRRRDHDVLGHVAVGEPLVEHLQADDALAEQRAHARRSARLTRLL